MWKSSHLTLIVGLTFVLVTTAAGSYTTVHIGWMAANFLVVSLSVFWFAFAIRVAMFSLTIAAIISLSAGALCNMYMRDYTLSRSGTIVRNVEVGSAPLLTGISGYYFRGSSVRSDLHGVFVDTSTDSEGHSRAQFHHVAPVVDEKWRRNDPVRIWAACEEFAKCRESWTEPYAAALRLHPTDDDLRTAARDAEAKHGITSAPDAIFVKWVASPEEAIQSYLDDFYDTLTFWCIAWVAALGMWQGVVVFRAGSAGRTGGS